MVTFFPQGHTMSFFLSYLVYIWVFPKIGVPPKGWFTMENPIKMDDLGVPLFLETPIYIYISAFSKHGNTPCPQGSSSFNKVTWVGHPRVSNHQAPQAMAPQPLTLHTCVDAWWSGMMFLRCFYPILDRGSGCPKL